MKTDRLRRDWAVLITTCMAVGGIFTALFLCVFVDFGLNSLVGKEALYVCLVLNAANVFTLYLRRRRSGKPARSTRLQAALSRLAPPLWCAGVALLLFALIAGLCGVGFGEALVYYPCLFGTLLVPLAWLGIVISYCETK